MTALVLPWVMGAFALAFLLNLWRLLRGPGPLDRILALDTLYVNALALLIVLGIHFRTQIHFETALVIAMLGFLGTVVLSKFLARGHVME